MKVVGNMKLPYIDLCDSVSILVTLDDGMDDNGVPNIKQTYTGKCNFIEKHKRVYDKDGKMVTLEGKVIFGGDACPNINKPEGKVLINEVEYKIYTFGRVRSPDGTVHHCELELM